MHQIFERYSRGALNTTMQVYCYVLCTNTRTIVKRVTEREYPLSYSLVRPKVSSVKPLNGFTSISIDEANNKNCSVNSILVGMGTPLRLLCIVAAEWPSFVTSVMQPTSNHNGTWSDDLPQLFLWTRLQPSRVSSCRNYLEWDGQRSNFKIWGGV